MSFDGGQSMSDSVLGLPSYNLDIQFAVNAAALYSAVESEVSLV